MAARQKKTFEVIDTSKLEQMGRRFDELTANPAVQPPNLLHLDYDIMNSHREATIESAIIYYKNQGWIRDKP